MVLYKFTSCFSNASCADSVITCAATAVNWYLYLLLCCTVLHCCVAAVLNEYQL
jgi:hypothetical protein